MVTDDKTIFHYAKENNFEAIKQFTENDDFDINERNDNGLTALHICATYNCVETAVQLLHDPRVQLELPDFESGWTPLHRALYFGHFLVALILLKGGAKLGDEFSGNWRSDVHNKRETRSIRNFNNWTQGIDHEGNSPLDLVSASLSKDLIESKKNLDSTAVMSFGKSDFTLGIQLPKTGTDVLRPRRIDALQSNNIVQVLAGKYHSMAVTREGGCYAWGHGRGGRLGHGDECTQPEPLRISSLSSHVVRLVATSENHTLAIVDDGNLWAWGSNRYGQLGLGGHSSSTISRPAKISALQKVVVAGIAAAESHSVCFSLEGEVWAWGSNASGQLGLKASEVSSLPGGVGIGNATPKRVTALNKLLNTDGSTSSTSNRRLCPVVQVSAAAHSTLIITLARDLRDTTNIPTTSCTVAAATPLDALLKDRRRAVTEVFQWGHGNHQPFKVNFSAYSPQRQSSLLGTSSKDRENELFSGLGDPIVNIRQVAAGKFHNVAVSSAAHVYTWGLGSEKLGHGAADTKLTSPQLVEALLPEFGGGRIVFASVSSNRTCVVSDYGDLYTWGATDEKGVLGHGSGTYQPVPKRVVGIKRAVSVAAGDDHTVVLQSATLPKLPFQDNFYYASSHLCVAKECSKKAGVDSVTVVTNRTRSWSFSSVTDPEELESGLFSVETARLLDSASDGSGDECGRDDDDKIIARKKRDSGDSNKHALLHQAISRSLGVVLPEQKKADATEDVAEFVHHPLSLKELCQRQVARSIDLGNAVHMVAFAERYHCSSLKEFCSSFIQKNLDVILVQGKQADFDLLFEEWTLSLKAIATTSSSSRMNPCSFDRTARRGSFDYASKPYYGSMRERTHSVGSANGDGDIGDAVGVGIGRERSLSKDLDSAASVTRLIRSIRKKISSIESLERKIQESSKSSGHVSYSKEQLEKIARKVPLQSELRRLAPILSRLQAEERVQESSKLQREKLHCSASTKDDKKECPCPASPLKQLLCSEEPDPSLKCTSPNAEMVHMAKLNNNNKLKNSSASMSYPAAGAAPILPSYEMWAQMIDTSNGQGAGAAAVAAAEISTPQIPSSSSSTPSKSASPWRGSTSQMQTPVRYACASVTPRVVGLSLVHEKDTDGVNAYTYRPHLSSFGAHGRTVLSPSSPVTIQGMAAPEGEWASVSGKPSRPATTSLKSASAALSSPDVNINTAKSSPVTPASARAVTASPATVNPAKVPGTLQTPKSPSPLQEPPVAHEDGAATNRTFDLSNFIKKPKKKSVVNAPACTPNSVAAWSPLIQKHNVWLSPQSSLSYPPIHSPRELIAGGNETGNIDLDAHTTPPKQPQRNSVPSFLQIQEEEALLQKKIGSTRVFENVWSVGASRNSQLQSLHCESMREVIKKQEMDLRREEDRAHEERERERLAALSTASGRGEQGSGKKKNKNRQSRAHRFEI